MASERRANGRCYYYRVSKRRGRVVRQYLGFGLEAECAALEVRRRHEVRAMMRQHLREMEQCWQGTDFALRAASDAITLLFRAALLAAGFRQHDRGAWRRTLKAPLK